MTIQATIARENAISVEAQLTGHAKRADGGLNLRFKIHPHGIPKQLADAPIGTRYVVALVEVDDNEEPVTKAPQPRDTKLARRAALLCKDELFHRYLEYELSRKDVDEEFATHYLRQWCAVDSRSQILPGTEASRLFADLFDEYQRWRDAPKYADA